MPSQEYDTVDRLQGLTLALFSRLYQVLFILRVCSYASLSNLYTKFNVLVFFMGFQSFFYRPHTFSYVF